MILCRYFVAREAPPNTYRPDDGGSETLINIHQTTWRNNPEDSDVLGGKCYEVTHLLLLTERDAFARLRKYFL
jgi:hypothetical protein